MKPLLVRALDLALAPLTWAGARWLKRARRLDAGLVPVSRRVLRSVGVFPVTDHYYDPWPLEARGEDGPRELPGLDLNLPYQLELLGRLRYGDELLRFPEVLGPPGTFYYDNNFFEAGDAEFLYSIVRYFQPRRVVEVGGGFSTLLFQAAAQANRREDPHFRLEHVCIEPYEQPWLERLDVGVLRSRLEDVDPAVPLALERGDVLFLDSSHVIRPRGDVVTALLRIVPALQPGVLVHVHDIFTPRDYPSAWIRDRALFYNEQYLLEALLSCTSRFRVIASLNHLKHAYPDQLGRACPLFARQAALRNPASFWFVTGDELPPWRPDSGQHGPSAPTSG